MKLHSLVRFRSDPKSQIRVFECDECGHEMRLAVWLTEDSLAEGNPA